MTDSTPATAARHCWLRLRFHRYGLWKNHWRVCERCWHRQRGTDWSGPR